MILKLVLKSLRHDKVRLLTAMFGVASATGLVVWSLGLAMTAAGQGREVVRRMTEPFGGWVSTGGLGQRIDRRTTNAMGRTRRGKAAAPLPAAVVDAVRSTPGVESVTACWTLTTTLDYRPDGRVMQGPPLSGVLTPAEATGCPYQNATIHGVWPDPESDEPVAAVCTAVFTPRRLEPPPVGSPLVLLTETGTVTVKISAIIDFPEVLPGFPTVFASAGAMRRANGGRLELEPNLLLCRLDKDGSVAAVRKAVMHLAPDDELSVLGRREAEVQFANAKLNNFKRQAPLLLMLSVLTALCMLVNALTMGVEQKLHVLALLRTAGMTARQVVQMVMLEGMFVAASGWAAGLLSGWALLALFVRRMSEVFPEGVSMGWVTPALSAAGVALITALSLFWPCHRAMRIRPLEALELHSREPAQACRAKGRTAWLGFALLFPMLLLVLPLPISAMARSVLLLTVGLPLHVMGLLLSLPFFVRLVDRYTAPAVSAALRLDVRLLRQRISLHVSRTAGMVLTLAVGLGSYAAIHIWGASMMAPFVPSRTFPDVIVSVLPNGIGAEEARKLSALDGVEEGRCLAIEAAQFMITEMLVRRIRQRSGKEPAFPNVLIFGAEPQAAFGGKQPLARFHFREGERKAAAAELEKGGACVITKMFSRETGLGLGEELAIKKHARGGRGLTGEAALAAEEKLRIVGVVDVNWHLVTSRAQLRGRHGMPPGTMGPVFVSEAEARRLSGNLEKTSFLWLNLSDAYRAQGALAAGQRLEAEIRKALQIDEANTVRVHHRDEIEDGTVARGARLIGDMARASFWSLIVLSTGVITMLVASYHASAKSFAVMRAVGMTRGQLCRLLLGEAMVTGICGIMLSLISGFCIGWTFTGWTRAWMSFGGLPLTLSVPWLLILRGIIFTFALCMIMAVPPIFWLVKHEREEFICQG